MTSEDRARVELLQGTLDLIVLRALSTMGAQHAYGLAARLNQLADHPFPLNQGTLYVALVRLEHKGLDQRRVADDGGRPGGEVLLDHPAGRPCARQADRPLAAACGVREQTAAPRTVGVWPATRRRESRPALIRVHEVR